MFLCLQVLKNLWDTVFRFCKNDIAVDGCKVYVGGYGDDTFIIYPEYEGKEEGYKMVISDFTNVTDYLDLSQFSTIRSIDDILLEPTTFNDENALELKNKYNNQTMVVLVGLNKEDLVPENFLMGDTAVQIEV